MSSLGCGHGSQQATPQSALLEMSSALQRGDLAAAYALMSDDYRASHTLAAFQAEVTANKAEATSLSKALAHPLQTRTQAEVELVNGEKIRLESKAGRWLFVTPVADFYPQATPREALASFIRAVERARWDIVLALMPEAERAGLSAETLGKNLTSQHEELERVVALLKASLDSPIEEVSDRATMPYGESFTARFVLEDGRWKIEDPE